MPVFIGLITIVMAVFIGKASFQWQFSYASVVGLLLYQGIRARLPFCRDQHTGLAVAKTDLSGAGI